MNSDTTRDFHVAIVGAGIAGLALAMALHKRSVPFTVFEEAREYSVVGAGIGFGPNGMQAMDMIEEKFRPLYEALCVGNKPADAQHVFFEGLLLKEGLGTQLKHSRGPERTGMAIRPGVIPTIPADLFVMAVAIADVRNEDAELYQAHRKQLLDVMTSFIPIEKVKLNKRLTAVQQLLDRVLLTFADGEVAESSVLIGADGIKSIVREHVLQPSFPNEVEPVYANSYCYRGVIPMDEAVGILGDFTDVAKMYMGDKRACVTYRISGGKEFNFLLCVSDDNRWPLKDAVTQKVTYEEMMSDFDQCGVDNRFMRLLSTAQPIRWGLFHHRFTSTYYRGRVVLIGDSAHASLPFQAAGASQGLEDAVILSDLLTRVAHASRKGVSLEPYIQAAFDGYDSVRRPRAEKQVVQSAEVSDMIYFQHPETGSDMNKILQRLQNGRFDWLWFHDLNVDLQSASRRMDEVTHTKNHGRSS